MTSDNSGLQFQMPGADPRIGEESCRESGSGKPLEVRYFPLKWPSIPLTWSICENQHVIGPMELSNQCLLLFWIHCHAKPHRQRMAQGIKFHISLKRTNFLLTKEKHSGHKEVTLEVRTLPKPGFSSSMETVLRWVWQNSIFSIRYNHHHRAMVPIYMTFSMAQFITPMLMVVVDEKEKRIKESLRMVKLQKLKKCQKYKRSNSG